MVIATSQIVNHVLIETEMPTITMDSQEFIPPQPALIREREYHLEVSSPVRPPYSKSDSNSDLWSLSSILLKPFTFLKCQQQRKQFAIDGEATSHYSKPSQFKSVQSKLGGSNYQELDRLEKNDDSNSSINVAQSTQLSLSQQPIPQISIEAFEQYWKKQALFLDQILEKYEEKKQNLKENLQQSFSENIEQRMNDFQSQSLKFEEELRQLQQSFRDIMLNEMQIIRDEFFQQNSIREETLTTLSTLFGDISKFVETHEKQIQELNSEFGKMKSQVDCTANYSKQTQNEQDSQQVESEINGILKKNETLSEEILSLRKCMDALTEKLNSYINTTNMNDINDNLSQYIKNVDRISNSQSDHVALILSLQSRIKTLESIQNSNSNNTGLEERIKALEVQIARNKMLEVSEIELFPSENSLSEEVEQIPESQSKKQVSRVRSNSHKTSNVNKSISHSTAHSSNDTISTRKRAVSICTPATPRYDAPPQDNTLPKGMLATLRKDSIQHSQSILEIKKDMQQMKKIMNTWRIENKSTKEIVSKTMNQYDLIESRVNVLTSKNISTTPTQDMSP